VTLQQSTGGTGGTLTGVVLGMESQRQPHGKDQAIDVDVLNLVCAEGLRSATGYESSGLGLAFCRLAVGAQGGTIRVEDGTPRGSVFIVELPR